jgi:hypothetical protein
MLYKVHALPSTVQLQFPGPLQLLSSTVSDSFNSQTLPIG